MSKRNQERRRLKNAALRGTSPTRPEPFGWVGCHGRDFLCDDQGACAVFDTEERLRRLTLLIPDHPFEHTTISFEEIVSKMRRKAVFTFDQGSLRRFLAQAMLHGLCLVAEDDFIPNDLDTYMTRLSLIPT